MGVHGRSALTRCTILLFSSSAAILAAILVLGVAPKRSEPIVFPKGFLWGSATAAHQVEGRNTNNDWYEWEKAGKTRDPSGVADDHYNRYAEDFGLAQSMHQNVHRLSIEWSRIEPRQGFFSDAEVEHYRAVLKSARDHGLKTMVTLHHFTNPTWASSQGGWSNPEMARWFSEFVAYVVPKIGDLVDFWCTINEPNVMVLTGYVVGVTPPGKQDIKLAPMVLANLMKGHAKAYRLIHSFDRNAKVGFAHHMRVFEGYRWWTLVDPLVASWLDDFWNSQLLRAIKSGEIKFHIPFVLDYSEPWPELKGTLDWVGVNYYTRDFIKYDASKNPPFEIMVNEEAARNDLGWEIYPEGIYKSVMRAASWGWPVYITENGLADAEDKQRRAFLCDHLRELGYAIQDGADVRGYLHWSLLDNWEWIEGFSPRFGLVHVDYATQKRTIRSSALVLSEMARTNTLDLCRRDSNGK